MLVKVKLNYFLVTASPCGRTINVHQGTKIVTCFNPHIKETHIEKKKLRKRKDI